MARLALTDAYIMIGTGDVLNKGTILIRDARIEAIGTNVRVPADAEAWSLKDKVIIPGMIDAHTHLGLTQDGVGAAQSDEDEVDDPIVPHLQSDRRDQSRGYSIQGRSSRRRYHCGSYARQSQRDLRTACRGQGHGVDRRKNGRARARGDEDRLRRAA